jgi:T4 bacteriophage base plate protein.
MSKMNPLAKYTKIEEIFVKLASNNVVKYKPEVLKSIKLGVCARAARDEIMLNTPDALIGGDAVIKVIENCVPGIEDAGELFVNDVEQLLIAIKVASKEEDYEIQTKCPHCDHEGAFHRNLQNLLDTMSYFDKQPIVELVNGLKVYFKPYTWNEYSDFGQRMFQEQKKSEMIDLIEGDDDESTEQKKKMFTEVFEAMTQLNFDMIVKSIEKIETPDGDIVDSAEFILEWVSSLPKSTLKEVREASDELQEIGISHKMEVQCSECDHEWEIDKLRYDPSHFFGFSFSLPSQKK